MSATTLIQTLGGRGIRLASRGDRLVIDAPKGALTEADRRAMAEHKAELLVLITAAQPDPFDALTGPRRTPWGTRVWSDPDAPAIELFGPAADDVAGPAAEPAAPPDPWSMPVPRKRGR